RAITRRTGRTMAEGPDKELVNLLHVGKTGGTAVKHALRTALHAGGYCIRLCRHGVRLRDVPPGEKVVFFVRDPASRFVSGFYSRLRQGRPRYTSPWSRAEKAAFGRFGTPNDLAAAL